MDYRKFILESRDRPLQEQIDEKQAVLDKLYRIPALPYVTDNKVRIQILERQIAELKRQMK